MSPPRRIAVLTTGRQDFGILRSTVLELTKDPRFDMLLWAGGMHLSPRFGNTIELVRDEGFRVDRELAFVGEQSDPAGDAARAVIAVTDALQSTDPDCLVLVGDRSETLAAGMAATLYRLPIVHIHGGEETEGAIDNVLRHALTKLSHLHLVSHPVHAQRVRQMGEDPASIVVVGSPGLDNLHRADLLNLEDLRGHFHMPLTRPILLVTVHPTTLANDVLVDVRAVAEALDEIDGGSVIITLPNADHGGDQIQAHLESWAAGHDRDRCHVTAALGERIYWSLLREVDVVLGNSSSGLIEAPAAGAPVVNVGPRQQGRLQVGRIWDVVADGPSVVAAVRKALAAGREPPSGGNRHTSVASRIVAALAQWDVPLPPSKRFRDVK